MVLMMPKDENEGQHLVYTASKYDQGPIAIRYPRGNGLGVKMDEEFREIPIGSWEVLKEGTDAAILTFGTTIGMALEAAETLSKDDLTVKVVNARFIKPMDEAMLHDLFKSGMPVVTIEEAVLQGGFGSAVVEFASDHGYTNRVVRMGIPDRFIEHGSVKELMNEIDLTAAKVAENVKLIASRRKQKRA